MTSEQNLTAEEPTDKELIQALKDGESYIVPESDYGKAEIWRKNDYYILFAIPLYGGKPTFSNFFGLHAIDALIETYESWT